MMTFFSEVTGLRLSKARESIYFNDFKVSRNKLVGKVTHEILTSTSHKP